MKRVMGIALVLVVVAGTSCVRRSGDYEANWESLNRHQPPEWLQDAKYGIYAHWGLYSVPAVGSEWYAKLLYSDQRPDVMDHHRATYGSPAEFGYKDFYTVP